MTINLPIADRIARLERELDMAIEYVSQGYRPARDPNQIRADLEKIMGKTGLPARKRATKFS